MSRCVDDAGMSKPVFHIAYQRKRRLWKILENDHTHPALYAELRQAIDYVVFRCPEQGAVLRVKDEAGVITEREIESDGLLYGFFDQTQTMVRDISSSGPPA